MHKKRKKIAGSKNRRRDLLVTNRESYRLRDRTVTTLLRKKSHAQRRIFQRCFLENGPPSSYTTLAY